MSFCCCFGSLRNLGIALFLLLCILRREALAGDPSSEKSALLALRDTVAGAKALQWNPTDPTPCQWRGVRCQSNQVSELRLPGVGLSGEIPAGIFGNLTNLKTLSLRFNALSGSLPGDLGRCAELRNLYLQGNEFSGEIPAALFGLRNLVRLNLARNSFSGKIPSGFNNLSRLATLFLDRNQLSGSIPAIDLPLLAQFNVSFNRLNGSIPLKLRTKPVEAFLGNSLCGGPMGDCPNEGNDSKSKLSGGAIVGIVIGSLIGVVLIVMVVLVLCRKRRTRRSSRSVDIASVKPPLEEGVVGVKKEEELKRLEGRNENVVNVATAGNGASGARKLVFFANSKNVFELEDLLRASAEVLGKGTFGTTYKALLDVGDGVAVKRLRDVSVNESEFRERIEGVGSLDHENLMSLRAYYYSRDEKLLVFDYMSMGSLSALLHGNRGGGRTPLSWEIRSRIALGVARGIEYLHTQGSMVSHGNITASNILLTETYNAKVSDFCLAQLVGPSSNPNRIAGYRAPEVTDVRRVSQKADVYSYGVLLLELLTGKPPTNSLLNEDGVDLPRWVQSVVREEWTSEVFALELLRYQNAEEEMVQLLQLALDCAAQFPDKRPWMTDVVSQIEDLAH
ncbi:hypothetical protein Sjap_014739 [Stephania japonica]|uniref:Protein kinase domain-containing protein n=1 Tax=Stephania japonica TaxID=461633 RepID=A0AAP0NQ89_9MAGN